MAKFHIAASRQTTSTLVEWVEFDIEADDFEGARTLAEEMASQEQSGLEWHHDWYDEEADVEIESISISISD